MKKWILWFFFIALTATTAFGGTSNESELLSNPRYLEGKTEPEFASQTLENLKQHVRVVSSRNCAVFGFNTPGVRIHLPWIDNNIYATVEFENVKLLDSSGAETAYEKERGIYDHDSFRDEIRFLLPGGAEGLVDYAFAQGKIHLRYPLTIKTVSIRKGGNAPEGLKIDIDGPSVTWSQTGDVLPEAAPFTDFAQFRAYDKAGRRLEQHPNKTYQTKNGVSSQTLAFWGEVAEVRVDLVESWGELAISFRLPPAGLLPQSRIGTPDELQPRVPETKGGTVVIEELPSRVEKPLQSVSALSEEEALSRLKKYGVSRIDPEFLVLSTVRGKTEAVEILLSAGVPVDSRHMDMTALIAAAQYGRTEIGIMLIDAGADVNAVDKNGATPLILAASKCRATALLQALIKAGADTKAQSKAGGNALTMADAVGCSENAAALRSAGAH